MLLDDLSLAGPILLPALTALLLLAVDLMPGSEDADGSFQLGLLGSALSLAYAVKHLLDGVVGYAFSNTLDYDRMALIASALAHASAFLAILLSRPYLRTRPDIESAEYYAMIMTSAAGMAMLSAANDLVNVFLAIELLSIPLYVLATIRRGHSRSIEAGLKYLLLGAFASSFLLFGMGLIYGASGTTLIGVTSSEFVRLGTGGGLAAFGCAMFLVGILFKVAAVPFHMWTPDVYEGSPTPITAFMATATKAAVMAALLRCAPMLATGFGAESGANVIAGIAVVTMFVGNLGALRQTNLKRLLAYSSIAHGGYMLVGLAAVIALDGRQSQTTGAAAILYYLAAYTAMNIGAFGVAVLLDRGEGREGTSELAGLGRERPLLALIMSVFVLALAGIPPTAGFIGKLYLFQAAVEAELYVPAVMGVLASVIGLFYYLRLLMVMWVDPAADEGRAPARGDLFLAVASGITVLMVAVLGLMPGRFVEFVEKAVG